MTNNELARIHRKLRIQAGMRQADVAQRAGVGRWKVVMLEGGKLGDIAVDELRASFDAIGARLDLVAWYQGARLDRLLDEVHARLVGLVVEILQRLGWVAEVEVSFSVYGDRGSIDVFAWHFEESALLVVEVKSELGALDGLLRPLDVKVRHASKIARERFGWDPATVSRIVVLPEGSASRRAVARHARVLHIALPARSRDVRRWLREPSGPLAGLWFLSDDGAADTNRNLSAIRRVRRSKSAGPAKKPRLARPRLLANTDPIRLIDPHKVGQADN